MEVYRETRSIDRPLAVVAKTVLGDADARQRSIRRVGLYRTETVLDESAGVLRTTVDVPGVVALTVLAVGLAGLGVGAPEVRLLALWAGALAVLLPLGHLLPGVDRRPGVGRVVERRVTPVAAPAFVAVVGSLWLALYPPLGNVATGFAAALLAVGVPCYAVGAGWRTASVSSLWLPASGLLPLVATLGDLAVVRAVADTASPTHAVVAGLAVTLLSLAAVVAYSALVCRSVRAARFEPLGSPWLRRGLLAGYLAVVTVLAAAVLALAGGIADRFGVGVVAVLAAPLALPVGGWLHHVGSTTLARVGARRRADRRTVDGVRLYVLDVDRPLVRAVPVPRGVFVSRRVVETLSEDELVAVVAHERHHLHGRSPLSRVALVGVGVLVGWNPIAAFLDHPARERSADRYAADIAGAEPLVRALRRLEDLDRGGADGQRLVSAPHALLYGTVADAAMYPSVDERVAAISNTA